MLNIVELEGIPSNSGLTQFPEFRTGVAYTYWGLTFDHTPMQVVEAGDRFRYGISGMDGIDGN